MGLSVLEDGRGRKLEDLLDAVGLGKPLGDAVGELYVAKHFQPKAKAEMVRTSAVPFSYTSHCTNSEEAISVPAAGVR